MTAPRCTLADLRAAIERADIPDDVRADLLAHLDPSDTRTRIVRLRMTDAERDALRKAADHAGMTGSAYLRSLLRRAQCSPECYQERGGGTQQGTPDNSESRPGTLCPRITPPG